jgi:DNA-binding CsgD family transcriptional regulator
MTAAAKTIPHGTENGYVYHRCRCEECRRARRENVRRRADSKRPGVQAYKNRWNREHRPLCDCGAPRTREAEHCRDCRRRAERTAVDDKRTQIQRLWCQGATLREIAAALGTTANSIGTQMTRMRAEGWDLPYRPGYPR